MKLYISDLHFFEDKKFMDLDKRGFDTPEQMAQTMIENWNNKVRGGDIIYVLGDFFHTKDVALINSVLRKLKGKICLIEGNHDCMWLGQKGVELDRFEWIKQYAELEDHNSSVILSHYPTFCYNHQNQLKSDGSPKTYMLYGHVHDTVDEQLVNNFINQTKSTMRPSLKAEDKEKPIPCNMINCFCRFSNYTPLSLKEWLKKDEERRGGILN